MSPPREQDAGLLFRSAKITRIRTHGRSLNHTWPTYLRLRIRDRTITAANAQISIDEQDVSQARARIEQQWAAAAEKTYSTASAKAEALEKSQVLYHHGEHGTEWGSVIHLLLETAMSAPAADLGSLALAALSEQGLDSALAEDALETVASVTRSEIWKRALESPRRMVEAAFPKAGPG